MHLSSTVRPRKKLYASRAYNCVWDAFNVTNVGSNAEHTAGQRKQTKQNDHHNYSYFIHRTTVDVHMSPWLSAGTHSPRSLSAHSGAHTHAELLKLPSLSRRRDGARMVVVVDASVAAAPIVVGIVFDVCSSIEFSGTAAS
ncbi:hypothetical protein, conserved [Trypanosoma cruzi]|uniref:Uncharacterized protein n=1 Tax=Trypanosoma cruzi (strain CL Brener) TaxID=353153 RepID=Q4CPH2_TRYCC|nr:hypothetical protein, conserved [Trypanosoma cruzi]EAN82175.1 hypothetical protein, conserved [Trypanosoma cruzi]|eukprot:XP_804026.1 hypothetical protein [Trypanosoma cruzi strain CL Brener]